MLDVTSGLACVLLASAGQVSSLLRLVPVDDRRALTVVAHPGHEVLAARAATTNDQAADSSHREASGTYRRGRARRQNVSATTVIQGY
jgi:hypothetical protein